MRITRCGAGLLDGLSHGLLLLSLAGCVALSPPLGGYPWCASRVKKQPAEGSGRRDGGERERKGANGSGKERKPGHACMSGGSRWASGLVCAQAMSEAGGRTRLCLVTCQSPHGLWIIRRPEGFLRLHAWAVCKAAVKGSGSSQGRTISAGRH